MDARSTLERACSATISYPTGRVRKMDRNVLKKMVRAIADNSQTLQDLKNNPDNLKNAHGLTQEQLDSLKSANVLLVVGPSGSDVSAHMRRANTTTYTFVTG
jgi:hypothetical protein